MSTENIPQPRIASREEWKELRKQLLVKEKQLTREWDALNAERRRMPMVKIDKEYTFDGPNGKASLSDLFEGRRQLIIYHFMFGPDWDKGCMGCTGYVNELGNLSFLNERNTTFALVSRAPLAKLEAYKAEQGWNKTWYSSFDSDFNYDFHVTFDPSIALPEYNYQPDPDAKGESHGLSVFFRTDDGVFHTDSTFARGVENLTNAYSLLDRTPYGRQEDWEDSPEGWPQKPTYG